MDGLTQQHNDHKPPEKDNSHSSMQRTHVASCKHTHRNTHTQTHILQSRAATPATSISRFTFSGSTPHLSPSLARHISALLLPVYEKWKSLHYECIVFTCSLHTNYVRDCCWCFSESSWPQQCPQGLWQEQMSSACKSACLHTHDRHCPDSLLGTATYLTRQFMQSAEREFNYFPYIIMSHYIKCLCCI